MGCDIHLHAEIKIDGQWHHYAQLYIGRDYTLFGLMAGVRNTNVTPISQPKGIPDDITVITRISLNDWSVDGHTHSYLNGEEIRKLATLHLMEDFGYFFDWDWSDWLRHKSTEVEDIRFVFWFDN